MTVITFLDAFSNASTIANGGFELAFSGTGPNAVVTDGSFRYAFDFSPANTTLTAASVINNLVVSIDGVERVAFYDLNMSAQAISEIETATPAGFASPEGHNSYIGSAGDDTIVAQAEHDQIKGGAGNDRLSAGEGFAIIYGNLGADTIDIVPLSDGRCTAYAGQDDDSVTAAVSSDIYGNLGNDTIRITTDDGFAIYGGQGDDLIYGGMGASTIFGNKGNDTIDFGSVGPDSTMDCIVFSNTAGYDTVLGFEIAFDKLKLAEGTSVTKIVEIQNGTILECGNASITLHGVNMAEIGTIDKILWAGG